MVNVQKATLCGATRSIVGRFVQLFVCFICFACHGGAAQNTADGLLDRALHLADLYNWADAAPLFRRAESLFSAAGHQLGALHAKLGRIRAEIERQDQPLPYVSARLGDDLANNPVLRSDYKLRMFALIVKGEIDAETNTVAMRSDWEEVAMLAAEIGDKKWQYRSLAQLGVVAFYDGDLETARKNVGIALGMATGAGDVGAQIRFLTMLANSLVQSTSFEQAIPFVDQALGLAATTPETGYQYSIQEVRMEALIGLGKLAEARMTADAVLMRSRRERRYLHEVTALAYVALIQQASGQHVAAISTLENAVKRARAAGLIRMLAKTHSMASQSNLEAGRPDAAQRHAELAAAAAQESGDLWSVPQLLDASARIHVARGRFREAVQAYDRASAMIDTSIGSMSSALEKNALIRASSEIYTRHFALVADHFPDPAKGYSIIEQVRGRSLADLMTAGTTASPLAKENERKIAKLRLGLMGAKTVADMKRLRGQIFVAEQERWVTPSVSAMQTAAGQSVGLEEVQAQLAPTTIILEYVLADPTSYCLVISRKQVRVARLAGRAQIDRVVSAYVEKVKSRMPVSVESGELFSVLLQPIVEVASASTLAIVRDGTLHLLPFDALTASNTRPVVETHTITYVPSATSYYWLRRQGARQPSNSLLAVGGVPYSRSQQNRGGALKAGERTKFTDLPASIDETRLAVSSLPGIASTVLEGEKATETAVKRAALDRFDLLHFAVHGVADITTPDRAALIFLSDEAAGEDGYLQAAEVAQLRLKAGLVVLSACDTAVGALQGQEGVATLSKAFLIAGAQSVISTLWSVDDDSSLVLMRRLYAHLSSGEAPDEALTFAKRDILRTYGGRVLPYQWAAFTFEGVQTGKLFAPVQ